MSESETESQPEHEHEHGDEVLNPDPDEQAPDTVPLVPLEGDDENEEGAAQHEEDGPVSQAVMDEKELEKRAQRLDAENTRHAKRIGEIMDEAAVDLIPCPVCMDGIAGWVYAPEAQALPEEAQLRLRQLLGLSGLEGLKQAPFAEMCPVCDGQGEVKTSSRVVGYETATCERCNKMGWIRVGEMKPANGQVEQPAEIVTGPTVYKADSEDPEVRHLQERGWTVIPPFQPAQSA